MRAKLPNNSKFYLHVDSRFEELALAANEPAPARKQTKAHCDCRKSNEAFFGMKLEIKEADESFQMVPVKAKSDDTCPHCGYYTVQLVSVAVDEHLVRGTRFVRGSRGVIVATNVSTGEQLTFPTAREAAKAGYAGEVSICHAIQRRRPVNGWMFERMS